MKIIKVLDFSYRLACINPGSHRCLHIYILLLKFINHFGASNEKPITLSGLLSQPTVDADVNVNKEG